jgi:HD superfamily phosphohydrolase
MRIGFPHSCHNSSISTGRAAMAEKIIRDPVHDVIAFRLEMPTEALLFRLLSAAEVQRLRRVRQLGLASLAYPGADHSRYSHSLGVMETARQIIEQLRRSFYMPEEDVADCLAAALLHDVGHGPFSHVFERVSGVKHETLTERAILDPDSDVHRILIEHDRAMPHRIVELMRCRSPRMYFCDILSSQLDADRLDYLLRDNLMTGSQYGDYDLTWLLHAFTIDESSQRLAIIAKGVSAVEAYLQARYHMYRNVYFHKVVRSAEGMVKLALQRARALAEQGKLDWPAEDDPVYRALLGQPLSMREFAELDDVSVQHCFKVWSKSADAVLSRLCRGLLVRELYKSIDLSAIEDREQTERITRTVADAIAQQGGDREYDLFFDETSQTPYETRGWGSEILVKRPDGSLKEFATISPLSQALNRQLLFRRLHVAPRWRDLAQSLVASQAQGG